MRLKHKVIVQVGQDSEFKTKLLYIEETGAEVSTDGYQRQFNTLFSIDAGGTEPIALGDVTEVKGLYVESDSEVEITLNGAAAPLILRKAEGATKAKMFIECDISSVSIKNPGATSAATGLVAFWGDPAA